MRKLIKSEKGLTLVEVLVTLVIMSIISGVIYSVFTTGLKLYQKIGIESQLRDDADYVATMILNEMYENPPNYIASYETTEETGIEMVRFRPKNVDGYLVEDSTDIEQDLLIYFEDGHFYIEKIKREEDTVISLEKNRISSDSSSLTTVEINGQPESSSISYSCTKERIGGGCENGRIFLKIVIADGNERRSSFLKTEPLILNSSFGF
ncbi:prepilin-type N-terminal cleavage/methylation domain-containing protein [Robertmurraya massiliosenegalensis]|uniref:PilW family protein n=1 Tax=Robertmurraya TaxID=2837507 RepID=UPI0039A6B3FF